MGSTNSSSFIFEVSDEQVDKLATILKKEGHNFSHDEVREIGGDLLTFYAILADGYEDIEADEKRLKTEPDGWKVENTGGWYCRVCGRHDPELWREVEGFRCDRCKQKGRVYPAK